MVGISFQGSGVWVDVCGTWKVGVGGNDIGWDIWGGWKLGAGGAAAPCGGAKFVLLPISQPR